MSDTTQTVRLFKDKDDLLSSLIEEIVSPVIRLTNNCFHYSGVKQWSKYIKHIMLRREGPGKSGRATPFTGVFH